MTDNETLKPPTLHGSPRVPVYLALVGPAPLLQSEAFSNLIADVGESVFAAVRDIAEKRNDIMSIMLEIVARARRQTVVTESPQGNKTLPDDPFKQGTEIATRTGERIYTLDLQKMAQESGAYMVAVDGEWQRATLPHSIYGETPLQPSPLPLPPPSPPPPRPPPPPRSGSGRGSSSSCRTPTLTPPAPPPSGCSGGPMP